MNTIRQIIAATLCALVLPALALAAEQDQKAEPAPTPSATAPAGTPAGMAELPFMKEEAKRLAALMERLQKATDPTERRKIMAETTCAQ